MRRVCLVCGEKPARKLPRRAAAQYKYAHPEPVFCSTACAVERALLEVGPVARNTAYWCRLHGWNEYCEGDPECGDCDELEREQARANCAAGKHQRDPAAEGFYRDLCRYCGEETA